MAPLALAFFIFVFWLLWINGHVVTRAKFATALGEQLEFIVKERPVSKNPVNMLIGASEYSYALEVRRGGASVSSMTYRQESYRAYGAEVRPATSAEKKSAALSSDMEYPMFILGREHYFTISKLVPAEWKRLSPEVK